ncbi:MAG: single-stranded-DNA-specific exonuclease RecJ, partial [Clostridiales bacterium]|nr:single-stranded-DNA-specific exonuclease RecJ [Clostridiales bacterium]
MRKLTARALPRQLPGYPDYLAALLHARGITTPADAARYLHPSMDQLHDPLLMHGMAEAVRVVHQAASEGLTCVVYGDYDADGVCASAILLSVLERLRVRAFSYIPARQSEGYGLNAQAVETLAGQAGLLISVDCGITALEEVARARALGMR